MTKKRTNPEILSSDLDGWWWVVLVIAAILWCYFVANK